MIHGQKRSHEVPAIFLPEGLLILLAVFQLFFLCFTHHSLPGAYSLLMAFTRRLRPMGGTFARVLAGI